ncbi:nucleotide-diphospho-sugar transferase [Synechococcus sp. PROS-7-1]|uniref:hypothetical protein n=1 Tax=Synechococcus sp. PROS-7-1 TaxID=1442556 RepID=UPI001644FD2A|nr:hypothetical protein [Synechococcus sp. PROS-7-1]QNI83919.1 nucleotide-diphospho-sugar transferase [Synechococcus sp. PROS-7-1]
MHVIVPLAGPDFIREDGNIKALSSFENQPLLQYVLNSRPWASKVELYTFILYDCSQTRCFVANHLSNWFQNFSIVYITNFSRGAAISALAGISLIRDFNKHIIIDLADIVYKSNVNVEEIFQSNSVIGGIALVFDSRNPQYSYLATDYKGIVTEAVEKVAISNNASAGTYIFRNSATVLNSLAHAIENEASQTYNNLFYVCPLFNGVLAQKKRVVLEHVSKVIDIKN